MSTAQPNALGRALLTIGDHRNLAIIQAAFRGSRRFGDWQTALDISDPVLTGRLKSLVDDGIFERVPYSTAPVRHEYRLTEAGKALWPVFVTLWIWETRWASGSERSPALIHHLCGHSINPLLSCAACGTLGITAHDTTAEYSDSVSSGNPPRRYRRAARSTDVDGDQNAMSGIDLLGDRWSTSVLSAAFLGAKRFKEFKAMLGPVAPLMLADRLDIFVKQHVLRRVPSAPGGKRMEYQLAPKGFDFFGVLATIVGWTNRWLAAPDAAPIVIRHRVCGQIFTPALLCNSCGEPLRRSEIHFEVGNS